MYTLMPVCSAGCSAAEFTTNFAASGGAALTTIYSGGTAYVNAIEICTDQTNYLVIDITGANSLVGYTGTSAAHDHTPDNIRLVRVSGQSVVLLFNTRVSFGDIKITGGGTAPNMIITGYVARETDFSV